MDFTYTLRPEDRTPPPELIGQPTPKITWVAAGLTFALGIRALVLDLAPAWVILLGLGILAFVVLSRLKASPPMDRILAQVQPGEHYVALSPGGLAERAGEKQRTIAIADIERLKTVGKGGDSRTFVLVKGRVPLILVPHGTEPERYEAFVRALYEEYVRSKSAPSSSKRR